MNAISAGTVRRIFIGEKSRVGIYTAVITSVLTLCFAALTPIQNSYRPGLGPDWLLLIFVVVAAAASTVYSYYGGGVAGCCLVLVLPSLIAFTTFVSVAPSNLMGVTPIWEWVAIYSPWDILGIVQNVFISTLIWSPIFGIFGFVLGKAIRFLPAIGRSVISHASGR